MLITPYSQMLNSINVSEFNSCLQFQNCELKKKKNSVQERKRKRKEKKKKKKMRACKGERERGSVTKCNFLL